MISFAQTKITLSKLNNHIESLIFVSQNAISKKEIKRTLDEILETEIAPNDIEASLAELTEKYQTDDFAIELVGISGGYQFMTKGAYHDTIGKFLKQTNVKRLSKAALETLSIIAYQQPVIKSEMEKIRGVSCDYSVQKLLEKDLVAIKGRGTGPGKPLLYGTSDKFMDYFGLESIKDLPQLKDLHIPDNVIGEAAPIEEDQIKDKLTSEEESKEEQVNEDPQSSENTAPKELVSEEQQNVAEIVSGEEE